MIKPIYPVPVLAESCGGYGVVAQCRYAAPEPSSEARESIKPCYKSRDYSRRGNNLMATSGRQRIRLLKLELDLDKGSRSSVAIIQFHNNRSVGRSRWATHHFAAHQVQQWKPVVNDSRERPATNL